MEKEFEDYWQKHKDSLLLEAPRTLQDELNNAGKLNTVCDWLLAAAPLVVMVAFVNAKLIESELLNFLAAMVVGILATLLSMLLKPYATGKRSATAIMDDVKAYFYNVYERSGLDGLEKLRK